jgi:hypothetical protein
MDAGVCYIGAARLRTVSGKLLMTGKEARVLVILQHLDDGSFGISVGVSGPHTTSIYTVGGADNTIFPMQHRLGIRVSGLLYANEIFDKFCMLR